MNQPANIVDDNFDAQADEEITECLNLENPTSFFLFAGAGSGKTGSLVKALKHIKVQFERKMRIRGQKVAVITYTNAATNEIKNRTDHNDLFQVSTIHSFIWTLIDGFNQDIRDWLETNLIQEVEDLEEKQRKGRAGTKAESDRAKSITEKNRRIKNLPFVKKFTYSPEGNHTGRDALNHSEVIKMGADFILNKPIMRNILVNRHPFLLIDESQDTNKDLMNAFLDLETEFAGKFALGLFGDTMQRIYLDGKPDLDSGFGEGWRTPKKAMNHRSRKRIVDLINIVRSEIDNHQQRSRTDKQGGLVRFFIADSTREREEIEEIATNRMGEITGDTKWKEWDSVKRLVLEHQMAALRLGFSGLFEPLHGVDSLKTSLKDGSLPELRFFADIVLPLVRAHQAKDDFSVSNILKKHSPILDKRKIRESSRSRMEVLEDVRSGLNSIFKLWSNGHNPTFKQVLEAISQSNLFFVPVGLRPFADASEDSATAETFQDSSDELDAWRSALETPFHQIEAYSKYVKGKANFDTHQGVKGLEFPRVLVVIDDSAARGNTFSYDKLFRVKEKSEKDLKKEKEGLETGVHRTQRLFYVTCSRAEESLAVLAYVNDVDALQARILESRWFEKNEIECLK